MTIYWLSKFWSKERRILFRMDETLHHVDVPHPIHFLTRPNSLLFFICVCVCMCRYFLEWETIPYIHIHKYLCAHTHTLTHAVYVCTWRVGGYDGLRLYLPWFHPITQGQPRPALLPSAHPLTYTILVCACPHVCVCVCVCVAYEHVYFYSVCISVCVYEDGGKEERIFSSALTHTHTQKKKMRYRFQSQRASKSVKTGILVL